MIDPMSPKKRERVATGDRGQKLSERKKLVIITSYSVSNFFTITTRNYFVYPVINESVKETDVYF